MNEDHPSEHMDEDSFGHGKSVYEKYTLSDLESLLAEAVQNEDYEKASQVSGMKLKGGKK
jgi:protein-arginine kinase activator protein McsA